MIQQRIQHLTRPTHLNLNLPKPHRSIHHRHHPHQSPSMSSSHHTVQRLHSEDPVHDGIVQRGQVLVRYRRCQTPRGISQRLTRAPMERSATCDDAVRSQHGNRQNSNSFHVRLICHQRDPITNTNIHNKTIHKMMG